MEQQLFKELKWTDARELVQKVNPQLAAVIDGVEPDDTHTFFVVKYPYGEHLLNKSDFMLPHGNTFLPLNSSAFSASLQERLNYGVTVPMGMVLKRGVEVHMALKEDRVLPYVYVTPGKFFALWRVLDPDISLHAAKVWDLTAGARSLFLLPKISDEVSFRRLKREFKLRSTAPRNIYDQWQVFKEIANHSAFQPDWYTEVLFFSKEWLEHKDDKSVGWQSFYRYFYEVAWNSSQFPRNTVIFNLIFSRAQRSKNLRPNPYLADTVKHLLAISMGSALGFGVANDESCAPVFELEKVFTDIYGLRNNYAATFMQPTLFTSTQTESIYYSLRHPTALEFSPRSRNLSSTLKDLVEVKHILDSVKANLLSQSDLIDTTICESLESVEFKYYHSEPDALGEVSAASSILDVDSGIAKSDKRQQNRVFCESSPFFKGCIALLQNAHK